MQGKWGKFDDRVCTHIHFNIWKENEGNLMIEFVLTYTLIYARKMRQI